MINSKAAREQPNVVIITGLSGSGMSSALNVFEDKGFFSVDNLPLALLPTFTRLLLPDANEKAAIERAALVINIRERAFLKDFERALEELKQSGLRVFLVFLEASESVLFRRFNESRRPHPADTGNNLSEAIARESQAMSRIRQHADLVLDTSELNVHELRRTLSERFAPEEKDERLRVQLISFGQKYGGLRDVDLLFDVRHLPNPYFVPELRDLSGHDARIVKWLRREPMVDETFRRIADLLEYLLPLYQAEGKTYVSIGIACTGGRHRSVMMSNALSKHLVSKGFNASVIHRDVKRVKRRNNIKTIRTDNAARQTGKSPKKSDGLPTTLLTKEG